MKENKGSMYADYIQRHYGKTLSQIRKEMYITLKEHSGTRKIKMDIDTWRRTTPKKI